MPLLFLLMPKKEFSASDTHDEWNDVLKEDNLACREDEKVSVFCFVIEHLSSFYFILHSCYLRKKHLGQPVEKNIKIIL